MTSLSTRLSSGALTAKFSWEVIKPPLFTDSLPTSTMTRQSTALISEPLRLCSANGPQPPALHGGLTSTLTESLMGPTWAPWQKFGKHLNY
jgi:hypothetical protein